MHTPVSSVFSGSTVGGYALVGAPVMLEVGLLGMLAVRRQVPDGFRFLGFVWAGICFIVAAIVMSFFMPNVRPVEGLTSAALQSEVWLLARLGWWAGHPPGPSLRGHALG